MEKKEQENSSSQGNGAERRKRKYPGEKNGNGTAAKKKRDNKMEFIYGNYPFYYGYRVGRTLEEDPRVGCFHRDWIENKDCLDVGCNEGHITIALSVKFSCKTMLGVDIDSKLIHKARLNLRHEAEAAEKNSNLGLGDGQDEPACLSSAELSKRITFRTQNYLESKVNKEAYDTVLCLSISKWIHLNWGDDGLLRFFAKIFEELRPGGMLVLEPQPWESYTKKRRVSEVAKANFKTITLRPDDFPSILTEKTGFKSFEKLSSELPSDKTGFRRPLFIYYK